MSATAISRLFAQFLKDQEGQAVHSIEKQRISQETKILWRGVLDVIDVDKQDLPKNLTCASCKCAVGDLIDDCPGQRCYCHHHTTGICNL